MTTGFRLILASRVGPRDGIAVELNRESGEQVAEVFLADGSDQLTFASFTEDLIPLDAIEALLSRARAEFQPDIEHEVND